MISIRATAQLHTYSAIIVAVSAILVTILIMCTPAQVAEVQSVDKVATSVTGLACDVAAVQPVGQPWTDFVCDALETGEAVVAQIPVPDAGPDAATVPPATVLTGQVLVHVPASAVSTFLETHPRRHHRAAVADAGAGG
jgi:hypothetical protein